MAKNLASFLVLTLAVLNAASGEFLTRSSPITDSSLLPRGYVLMPGIFWDSRNPLFHCPNKGVNTINVRPYDALQFLCPMKDHNIDWHNEHGISSHFLHENAFLTDNETAMEQCDATNVDKMFLRCNSPEATKVSRRFRVRKYSPRPEELLFQHNKTYYIFSTGTGREMDLDQRVGGRCDGYQSDGDRGNHYKMKLKLRVCADEEAATEKCPICLTAACYNHGCGTYSGWRNTSKYQREGNRCFAVHERTCDFIGGACEGPAEKLVPTDIKHCIGSGTYSGWRNTSKYQREGNRCFKVHERTCDFIGGACEGPAEKLVPTDIKHCIEPRKVDNHYFNKTYVIRNNTCYAVFKKLCHGDLLANISANATNATACIETEIYMKVDDRKCQVVRWTGHFDAMCSTETGTVEIVTVMFVVILVSIAVCFLVFGFVIGFICKKRSFRSIEECSLTSASKSQRC